jgi:hypothetical protein
MFRIAKYRKPFNSTFVYILILIADVKASRYINEQMNEYELTAFKHYTAALFIHGIVMKVHHTRGDNSHPV